MITINIFGLKSKSEKESYEFFDKYFRKLPRKSDGAFDKNIGVFDDNDVDAVRHAYTSGIFTQEYGEKVAEVLGEANELIPFGGNSSSNNSNSKKMDLWNNRLGRKLGRKTSGKLKLFKLILKALRNNELIIDPDNDPRIPLVEDAKNVSLKDKVVVIKESKKGKNLSYLDIDNSIIMSRMEFIENIKAAKYPNYEIRSIKGDEIPVSKKDKKILNNLG